MKIYDNLGQMARDSLMAKDKKTLVEQLLAHMSYDDRLREIGITTPEGKEQFIISQCEKKEVK